MWRTAAPSCSCSLFGWHTPLQALIWKLPFNSELLRVGVCIWAHPSLTVTWITSVLKQVHIMTQQKLQPPFWGRRLISTSVYDNLRTNTSLPVLVTVWICKTIKAENFRTGRENRNTVGEGEVSNVWSAFLNKSVSLYHCPGRSL